MLSEAVIEGRVYEGKPGTRKRRAMLLQSTGPGYDDVEVTYHPEGARPRYCSLQTFRRWAVRQVVEEKNDAA